MLNAPDIAPPLALRSDGKVLLSVSHVEGADLAGRERWEGIVLSVTETAEVFRAMCDAADNAAGHTAGRIRWRDEKRDSDSDEGVTVERMRGVVAFGREVRRRRMARGWTLDALTDIAGLTSNFIPRRLATPRWRSGPFMSPGP